MEDALKNETELREFFLGRMKPAERDDFEIRLVEDAGLFETAEVVESELIDSYALGSMSEADRLDFERFFLIDERRRERVAMVRRLRVAIKGSGATPIENEPWYAWLRVIFSPAFAAIAVVCVVSGILGLWYFTKADSQIDVATVTPTPAANVIALPTATATASAEPLENVNLKPANSNRAASPNSNRNSVAPATPPRSLTPVIALAAGAVRSGGRTTEVELGNDMRGAILRMRIDKADYRAYRADVLDQNGQIIFRTERLIPRDHILSSFVPANILPRGDYAVRLYGLSDSSEESVADYQFRVNRK